MICCLSTYIHVKGLNSLVMLEKYLRLITLSLIGTVKHFLYNISGFLKKIGVCLLRYYVHRCSKSCQQNVDAFELRQLYIYLYVFKGIILW